MNWSRNHVFIPAFCLALFALPQSAQQCSDCDCYHIPIKRECEKCCGFASGKITSVTNSTLSLEETSPTNDAVTAKKTFALTPKTKKNAALKPGVPATVYYRRDENEATEVDLTEALTGLLIPANEPDPPLPDSCSRFHTVPSEALKVYLGGNAGWTTSDEVTVLNVSGNDLIDLRRTPNGLAINAKTFSEDGKVIAQIVDNRFYVTPSNSFRLERPDVHSIVVYDPLGQKVMDVRYVSRNGVRVLGIFHVPGGPTLTVSESELSLGGFHSVGSCFGGRTLFKFGG